MNIQVITYAESREEFFQNRLNKARASLDNVVKYGTDPDACAEKGYIVSFYEDAITALRDVPRLTSALAAKEDLYSKSIMLSADLLNKLAAKDELLKQAVEDIKCNDHCDVCKFSREGEEDCTKYDFDCAKCQSRKCVCRTCRNESKWQWRGKKGDG